MERVILRDGEWALANARNRVLVSGDLGDSSIVSLHDPLSRITGMVRFPFPEAGWFTGEGTGNPCLFADTAVVHLLERMEEAGMSRAGLRSFIFARVLNWAVLSAQAALWKHQLLARVELGAIASLSMTGESARFWIRYHNQGPASGANYFPGPAARCGHHPHRLP